MKRNWILGLLLIGLIVVPTSQTIATEVEGTIMLGGVVLDEDAGDLSSVQETYNIHDGFNVTSILLNGSFDPKKLFSLNLRSVNLDNRQGDFEFRVPSLLRFYTNFDQNRQVFDPDRAVTSERKDWRFGTRITPAQWMQLWADYNLMTRKGDRLSYPAGVESALGSGYDYTLGTGRIEGQFRQGPRVFAVAYDFSEYKDDLFDGADRSGMVVSGRLFLPDFFFADKVTHAFRASYGKQEVSNSNLEYTLSSFQYHGTVLPIDRVQFKYGFLAQRIDDDSDGSRNDNFHNSVDVIYRHLHGRVSGGYTHYLNDYDISYNTFRAGATLKRKGLAKVSVDYSNRTKADKEKETLLQEYETATFKAKLDVTPAEDVSVGMRFANRMRDLSDIGVKMDGQNLNTYFHYDHKYESGFGVGLNVNYTYSEDDYEDLVGAFNAKSNFVTARLEPSFGKALKLAGGVTYMDVGEDLDIEKSILFVEAMYTFRDDYHLQLKYNAYEYDDFVLVDRYYDANVFWFNVGYDFGIGQK